eukprot:contig_10748_g2562
MKSEETRHHLVRMVLHDNVPVARASQSLGMSRRSASRFLKYYEETGGSVHYDPAMWNRHADNVMDDAAVKEAVLSAVEEHPELFLDEMATAVAHVERMVAGGLGVSVASVCRVLAHNGYTRKVIEKAFYSRNKRQRADWVAAQWEIPLRCRVYVDEAHRTGRAAERRWAWSQRGERAECYVASSAGVRTSFFAAMAHDSMLDWMVTLPPPGQSSVDFLLFIVNRLLPYMDARDPEKAWVDQPDRCVLVLDNTRVHDAVALSILREAGVFVVLLPSYSPDFNPIEDVFSVGSSWLRRWSSRAQYNAWPMLTVDTMLSHVREDMCSGFVRAAVRQYLLYVP